MTLSRSVDSTVNWGRGEFLVRHVRYVIARHIRFRYDTTSKFLNRERWGSCYVIKFQSRLLTLLIFHDNEEATKWSSFIMISKPLWLVELRATRFIAIMSKFNEYLFSSFRFWQKKSSNFVIVLEVSDFYCQKSFARIVKKLVLWRNISFTSFRAVCSANL